MNILSLAIIIPLVFGLAALLIPSRYKLFSGYTALFGSAVNFALACSLFGKNIFFMAPWAQFGVDFSLRLYHFSAFILLAVSVFALLIVLYSVAFMKEREKLNQFYFYFLASITLINGAVLSNNLVLMLFFWEGLLLTMFGMITIGGKYSFKTATKALIILGISDLCMMFGIGLTGYLSKTFTISDISLSLGGLSSIAFLFLVAGAISKAGSMPFHSWIPDAAVDAPLPFMAILPASLEKLLGIYFLTRITLDMFKLSPDSRLSIILMSIGGLTIILAVMMALVQKDYKRLLSYHAISQVGYMILGIGTCLPAGIIGGLFHMINNALYKSCLFLTGGAVEKQTGTTDLNKLGGLAKYMPVTFACFFVAAVSISGVPPFNGFFSKELIYDAALERGAVFYALAILGSFFTAASFLKLGHAAYFGPQKQEKISEAPIAMQIPMVVIAIICILFGIFNYFPINYLIQPILGGHFHLGHSFAGFPSNIFLVAATLFVFILAVSNHIFGVKKYGSGVKASDHIHYAPGLKAAYSMAEKRYFDPYNIGLKVVKAVSLVVFCIDRIVDWIYDSLVVFVSSLFGSCLKCFHSGSYALYAVWAVAGVSAVIIFLFR